LAYCTTKNRLCKSKKASKKAPKGFGWLQIAGTTKPVYNKAPEGGGTEACESLLSGVRRLGARTVYLQVARDNSRAAELHTSLDIKRDIRIGIV
jgi:hypothetical protein